MTSLIIIAILSLVFFAIGANTRRAIAATFDILGGLMWIWLFLIIAGPLPPSIATTNYQLHNRVKPSGQITQYFIEDGKEVDSPSMERVYDVDSCSVVKGHYKGWIRGAYIDYIGYHIEKKKENIDE